MPAELELLTLSEIAALKALAEKHTPKPADRGYIPGPITVASKADGFEMLDYYTAIPRLCATATALAEALRHQRIERHFRNCVCVRCKADDALLAALDGKAGQIDVTLEYGGRATPSPIDPEAK